MAPPGVALFLFSLLVIILWSPTKACMPSSSSSRLVDGFNNATRWAKDKACNKTSKFFKKFGYDVVCQPPEKPAAAGFSWWVVVVSLLGAALVGCGAWLYVARGRSQGSPMKVRPPKFPCHWFASSRDASHDVPPPYRPPAPLPASAGPAPLYPAPLYPAPPVPVSQSTNSLYGTPPAGALVHVYARPVQSRGAPFGRVNEHVHIYETPPCFPGYDYADQEIDTSAFKKPSCGPERTKC